MSDKPLVDVDQSTPTNYNQSQNQSQNESEAPQCNLENQGSLQNPDDEMSLEIVEQPLYEEDHTETKQGVEGSSDGHDVKAAEGQKASKETSHKQAYDIFMAEFEQLPAPEDKLRCAVAFMSEVLSSKGGTPHFKSFWDARNIALLLFKENPTTPSRVELWGKYSDLSKEARHLRQMLDEQGSFAAEQIEIAVLAIEQGLLTPQPMPMDEGFMAFLRESFALESNRSYYSDMQADLNRLNAWATRVTGLRKELIRTEMRIRQKNKFFQRLSAIGDQVFPARKELIKEISQKFCDDVDAFIDKHFKDEEMQDSLFMLREEIKVLQNIAKAITLNTHAFKHSRMRLSACWDNLKHLDKERKKVRAQQKAIHRKNAEPLLEELTELAAAAETLPTAEVQVKLDQIAEMIHSIELGRDESRYLRDKISAIRKTLLHRLREAELERSNQMQEKERQRKGKLFDLKKTISDLTASLDRYEVDDLSAQREDLSAQIADLPVSKQEKFELERALKPIRDAVTEKRERSLLALSEDDRNALQQLKEILRQRKERRAEINNQLELFRKSEVSSGLDFEKAMSFSEQITTEKKRLEKISLGIKEVEEKIVELEGKA